MKDWVLATGAKLKKFTMNKVATFTLTKMNIAMMTSLVKVAGREKALEEIFHQSCEMGHEFMLELYSQMPSSVERIGGIAQAAWIIFAGQEPTETIREPIKIGKHEGQLVLVRDTHCPFCEGVNFDTSFCTFPVGAYQGASQTWSELTGHNLKSFVRETKCKAKGDPYCELTLLMMPLEMTIEELREERPELFSELQIGFITFE